MRAYDRAVLLERIERDGATIGTRMPDAVEVDGERHAVRSVVLELTSAPSLDDADRSRVDALVRVLRQARVERRNRLRSNECDRETGEHLADEIVGIDRALNALEHLDAPSVAEQARQQQQANQARWMSFLREALGHDTERRR